MTLREEIRRIVIQCCLTESRTDEILKLFEKKIDEKRREYSEPYEKNSYWHGYKDALIELLEELQKEKEFLK